jgi:hypothetical protein
MVASAAGRWVTGAARACHASGEPSLGLTGEAARATAGASGRLHFPALGQSNPWPDDAEELVETGLG